MSICIGNALDCSRSNKPKEAIIFSSCYKTLLVTLLANKSTLFLQENRASPQPSKLLVFSWFSVLKVAKRLPSSLTKQPMSARNTITFRIQNRYLWSVILKLSQKCFWDSYVLVNSRFNSYFTFITKQKLHFSLISSFIVA